MEDLFEGPARHFSGHASIAHGGAPYAQAPLGPDPLPLRHLSGYAPFVSFLASRGLDPRTTARDPLALVRFLRYHHRDIL